VGLLLFSCSAANAQQLSDYDLMIQKQIAIIVTWFGERGHAEHIQGYALIDVLPRALEDCGQTELALDALDIGIKYRSAVHQILYDIITDADASVKQIDIGDGRSISLSEQAGLWTGWSILMTGYQQQTEMALDVWSDRDLCAQVQPTFDIFKSQYELLITVP